MGKTPKKYDLFCADYFSHLSLSIKVHLCGKYGQDPQEISYILRRLLLPSVSIHKGTYLWKIIKSRRWSQFLSNRHKRFHTFSSVIRKSSNVKILSQIDDVLRNQTRKISTEDREDEGGAPQGNLEKTLNQVTLLGRVGSDPQKKGTMEHPAVVFSLATHVNYKYESGEQAQKTDWHRIVVFKPSLRDLVYTYMRKGQRVHISGKLSYGSVTEGTVTKPTASVIADDVIFFYSV